MQQSQLVLSVESMRSMEELEVKLNLNINGTDRQIEVLPEALLLDVLREQGFMGVKQGCREGSCGSCTVLLDGRPVLSCMTLAGQAQGRRIETVEGLGDRDNPHPLQRAFVDEGAVQCGFCTPGMLLSAKALLDRNPDPDREQILHALDGNLCRCTGYEKIVHGVQRAARNMRGAS